MRFYFLSLLVLAGCSSQIPTAPQTTGLPASPDSTALVHCKADTQGAGVIEYFGDTRECVVNNGPGVFTYFPI
jgi:hypothetical protein